MNRNRKSKLPPETLLYTGNSNLPTTITHIQYNKKDLFTHNEKIDLRDDMIDWFIIEGLQDVNRVNSLCKEFGVDSLVIEDILNVHQRNKTELYENYIFSVQEYSYLVEDKIEYDYISILLFNDKLVTFSEKNNYFISHILERLQNTNSIIRNQGHSYLFYVINDMIVDEKYSVFFHVEDKIDELETNVMSLDRKDEFILYHLRKELLFLRNSSSQLYDNIFSIPEVSKRIQDVNSKKYYADLKDHLLDLREKTKFELDVLNHLYEMHLNNLSRKMNSIMTTLTIFSAIFIPLSFIAGVFGMNFANFEILTDPNGMVYFILICVLIPSIMLIYFKIKKYF